jgi:DUF218 domain
MERIISRHVSENSNSQLLKVMFLMYDSTFWRQQGHTDAIAILTGMGEYERLKQPIEIWNKNIDNKWLLIANHYDQETTYQKITTDILKTNGYGIRRARESVIVQDKAENTGEQCDWLAENILKLNIKKVLLCAPSYHLLRAYGTLLASLDKVGRHNVVIIPEIIELPKNRRIPELQISIWDMLNGEIKRIEKYQELGFVASTERISDYLRQL